MRTGMPLIVAILKPLMVSSCRFDKRKFRSEAREGSSKSPGDHRKRFAKFAGAQQRAAEVGGWKVSTTLEKMISRSPMLDFARRSGRWALLALAALVLI